MPLECKAFPGFIDSQPPVFPGVSVLIRPFPGWFIYLIGPGSQLQAFARKEPSNISPGRQKQHFELVRSAMSHGQASDQHLSQLAARSQAGYFNGEELGPSQCEPGTLGYLYALSSELDERHRELPHHTDRLLEMAVSSCHVWLDHGG